MVNTKLLVSLNRAASWILTLISTVMLTTGYIITRLPVDRSLFNLIHTNLCYLFTVVFIIHFYISVFVIRYPWKRTLENVLRGNAGKWTLIKLTQRVSAWAIVLGAGVLIITGLGWYGLLWRTIPFVQHRVYDLLAGVSIVIHVSMGAKSAFTRIQIGGQRVNILLILCAVILIAVVLYADSYILKESGNNKEATVIVGETPNGTLPVLEGRIMIGDESYRFNPKEVNTSRPEIFKPGYFSIFDVLIHLGEREVIELEYHFDESMNTHIIDSLQQVQYWWYYAYYSGGWVEQNAFRPDLYPWKDGMNVEFYKVRKGIIDERERIWRMEVNRTRENEGKIIIPLVKLEGKSFNLKFEDVEVTAHNLRSDVFMKDTITAIDVIQTLGDKGLIDYELMWYEEIGTARIVKNYWVESINEDTNFGRCGFVYEVGDTLLEGFNGNHIHLPSDIRVINSPEYVYYFWICI